MLLSLDYVVRNLSIMHFKNQLESRVFVYEKRFWKLTLLNVLSTVYCKAVKKKKKNMVLQGV